MSQTSDNPMRQEHNSGERLVTSTGHLPLPEHVRALMYEAHARFAGNSDGLPADVYPALAEVSPDLFGISVAGVDGAIYTVGDADWPFAIMSVSKPFIFGLVCSVLGADQIRQKLGVNATGLPFNSIMAVELSEARLTNPMVNSGALATTSLVPGSTMEEKWNCIHNGLSRFAGRTLELNEAVYASAMETNHRNRGIAQMLRSYDRLYFEPEQTTALYTRQCSLNVTAGDLAVMGATLANGGVNPQTGERVISGEDAHHTLAVMATAGLYETSGDWLYDIGLPGKSGIGGGIVTSAPGKGGMGVFAPRLDSAGNSVKGQLTARLLSQRLGLNLFASDPSMSGATVADV